MYTTGFIFPVIPIKHFVNHDSEPNMSHKLTNGTKTSVSNLMVLLSPCVVQKATTHIDKKLLNIRHRSQRCFRGISIIIPQHKKGYLIYVSSTRKIVSSREVVFD